MNGLPILSLILWLPTLGVLALLVLPREQNTLHRQVALGFAGLTFLVSCLLIPGFQGNTSADMHFVEHIAWIPSWGINYIVGVDSISFWLVLLTTFITPITLLSTWGTKTEERAFQAMMLLLETAMIGVFVAGDMILFYVFWEFSLIPMAFMIGIWGGSNRVYAAIKFFLYTFAGSVLMLLAMIVLASQAGTFEIAASVEGLRNGSIQLSTAMSRMLFGAFFLAFAIKVPLWPFHTWLPDAHVEAPTAGSVILAGVLLKMGTYGLIRFNLILFPEVSRWAAPAIAVLSIIGILYGAAVAFAQTDMKKLVAYSSVSHMGFVVLGIFALNTEGISGAVLQMINHGLSTGALFLIVGIIYERRHTRQLADFGGLWTVMPIYGGLTLVVVLSSVGLPGLNGFVGEFTIMQGAFLSPDLGGKFLLFAVIGVILAATYLLRMFNVVFMGEVHGQENAKLQDVNRLELTALVAFLVPIVLIGFYPGLFFGPMQAGIADVVQYLGTTL